MSTDVQTSVEQIIAPAEDDDCEPITVTPPSTGGKRKSSVPRRSKKAPQVTKTLVDGERKKRKYRRRPGTVALKEIRALQKTTNFLIQKAPVRRLIKQIAQEQKADIRMTKQAVEALHSSLESFATTLFADAMKLAVHSGRRQLNDNDLRFTVESYGMQMSAEYMEGLRKRLLIK